MPITNSPSPPGSAGSVARPDSIRRHNLAAVLLQVHRHGSLSRAELTSRLALSRSTIGDLVSELVELGWVAESVPVTSDRAGRPSHVVGPRPNGPYAVAADVDVDRLVVAAVPVGGHVVRRRITPLRGPASATNLARAIQREVSRLEQEMPAGSWPVGIGVSVPGAVHDDGFVEMAPNLGWTREPLGARLHEHVLLPVSVGNDANLGVLAEHLRGAARDVDDAVFLTSKTGVGAGILVQGQALTGVGGLAGEIGHSVLDPDGPSCHCGGRGHVEGFIGAEALLRLAGEEADAGLAGVARVLAGARAGQPAPRRAVRRTARHLGLVLANVVNVFNPKVVVLGGNLVDLFTLGHEQVAESMAREAMTAARSMVDVRVSGLGDDSSLIGAAESVFRDVLADPLATARV